jgi:putative membrane protein
MSKPKRLHTIAIFVHIGKMMKRTIIPLIGFAFLGHKDEGGFLFTLIASVIVLFFTLIFSFISWMRYTYHLEGEELRIEYGVFIRKKRYIPFERIQSLDMTEGILHRLVGLVKIRVETAGGDHDDGAEADLSAISKKEALEIQKYFNSYKKSEQLEEEATPIFRITAAQLLLLSITSGGVGVIISAILAIFSQMDEFIPYKKWFGELEKVYSESMMFIAMLIFFGFLFIWIVALIATMLKYANFTVIKKDGDLTISQGLLEKRQMTIPINRIQSIRLSENPIRQMMGYAMVYVESAGGSVLDTKNSNVVLFPMVKRNQLASFIEPYLNEYKIPTNLKPLPKRALPRYILRSWYIVVPVVIISLFFLKAWGSLSFILLGIITFWSFLKYKDAGWSLEHQQLSLRYRTILRHTVLMKKNKIQSMKVYESFFQRKKELSSIETFVKSGSGNGGGSITDIENADRHEIYSWYSSKQKGLM